MQLNRLPFLILYMYNIEVILFNNCLNIFLTLLISSIIYTKPVLSKVCIMLTKNEIKQKLTLETELFNTYHVSRVGLFGSYINNSQNKDSDIDLLIDFKKPVDLFAYVNLADKLSQSMHQKVDLVTINGLKPSLRNKILREVEWIEGI